MREIGRGTCALPRDAQLLHDRPAFFGEFVDQTPVVRARACSLLMRACDKTVGLARQEVEAIDQVIKAAAGEGMEVVGGQVAVAREGSEDPGDVALREGRDSRSPFFR